ncbi:hypothetical protein B0H13DRAFT_1853437 [Mycena leptocephala]|nr:hypothetical protein B0H13DRAFT_1853437 [Mycena leptocephala]
MAEKCIKRGIPNQKRSGRICRTMRPNKRQKRVSNKATDQKPQASIGVIPSTLPSYYDLVMEDIEGFLQEANAHVSGLRDFLDKEARKRALAGKKRENAPMADVDTLPEIAFRECPDVTVQFQQFGHLKDAKSGLPLFNAS